MLSAQGDEAVVVVGRDLELLLDLVLAVVYLGLGAELHLLAQKHLLT